MQTLRKERKREAVSQFQLTSELITKLNNFNLTPTAKLVLLYLSTCYNPKHKEVFPKQKTIADKLGISEISVTRAISELHKEGLILSERKISNKYVFTSRILSGWPIEMINDNLQNDMEENINLIDHNIEQIKGTKKEQSDKLNRTEKTYSSNKGGNVYQDKILREYAIKNHAKNIDAFVNFLKNSGRADKIIREYNDNKNKRLLAEKHTDLLRQIREKQKTDRIMPENCDAWLEFGKKHGIKK